MNMAGYERGGRELSSFGTELSPTQLFFLARLGRLLRLREEYEALLRPEDWESKLLPRAIYSTYCDCLQLGVGREARELLARKGARTG